ncbi:MAG: DUF4249 domain-containing protein [Bacteroidia bacterium]
MKLIKSHIFSLVVAVFALAACTDPIDIELDEGTPQVNIDAFITSLPEDQKVRVLTTTNYFDNLKVDPITNAEVVLTNNLNQQWTFSYTENGYYVLPYSDTIVRPFAQYSISVKVGNQEFVSSTTAFPTTKVDSIVFDEQIPTGPGSLDGFIGEFWGRDIAGITNAYWIKTYIDDTLISDPGFINLSLDAGQGPISDGSPFIPPVRTGITTFPNIFQKEERVKVEIHGISLETYEFITQAQTQITNGGLFATPPFNVITNFSNASGSENVADQPVGWFSVATVSSLEAVAE